MYVCKQSAPVVLVDLQRHKTLGQRLQARFGPEHGRPAERLVLLVCVFGVPLHREQQVVILVLHFAAGKVQPVQLFIEGSRRFRFDDGEQPVAHREQRLLEFVRLLVRLAGHIPLRIAALLQDKLRRRLAAQPHAVLAAACKPFVVARVVGADLRHMLLAEVQVHLAQVALVQERAALALIENEVRILPRLLVCRRDRGAQTP